MEKYTISSAIHRVFPDPWCSVQASRAAALRQSHRERLANSPCNAGWSLMRSLALGVSSLSHLPPTICQA
jgi:hypothetical protein